MIDPDRLLDHAHSLAAPARAGAPRQVELRKAISAAYYAVFHRLLQFGADALVGKKNRKTRAYVLVYRAFNHGDMRKRCREARKSALKKRDQQLLGINSFASGIVDCASTFLELQARRHEADYDPAVRFSQIDARTLVKAARKAIADFESAPDPEKNLFILYLLFGTRS